MLEDWGEVVGNTTTNEFWQNYTNFFWTSLLLFGQKVAPSCWLFCVEVFYFGNELRSNLPINGRKKIEDRFCFRHTRYVFPTLDFTDKLFDPKVIMVTFIIKIFSNRYIPIWKCETQILTTPFTRNWHKIFTT